MNLKIEITKINEFGNRLQNGGHFVSASMCQQKKTQLRAYDGLIDVHLLS